MRAVQGALLVAFAAGCDPEFTYSGFQTHNYMGLDGDRNWAYVLDDNTLEWRLKVDKGPEETRDGSAVYPLDYGQENLGTQEYTLLYTIWWSSDSRDGIRIHEIMDERAGKSSIAFETPIVIADPQMIPGESVTTETDGLTIVSTLDSQGSCPNDWITGTPWDCLNFEVDDGAEGGSGLPLIGRWELATDYGPSRFQQTEYTSDWVLSTAYWDESGD
ncbi:MAG: hypothetical protein AAFV53_13940 [Myxococcota bacterium]